MNDFLFFSKAVKLFERKKYKQAFKMFLKLAKKGDVAAMDYLALMYEEGWGAEYSLEKSLFWSDRALKAGSSIAIFNRGVTYKKISNYREARLWFERAALMGDGGAALELAKLYMISDKERENTKKYLHMAAASNSVSPADKEEAENLIKEISRNEIAP